MAGYVEMTVRANGQALEVLAPDVLASAVVNKIKANVELSSEWSGLDAKLAVRNCETGWTHTAEIAAGVAVVPSAALCEAGYIQVAVIAQNGSKRLTTEPVKLCLFDSGL